MQMKRLCAIASIVVGLAGGVALAQAGDPFLGTWKLNAAKSATTSFSGGTSVIEKAGDGIKVTVDLTGKDGTAHHWTFTAKYDGKDNPVTGHSPFGDVVAIERVDGHTATITVKSGGKVTVTQTMVVSPDGKTRTITTKGVDPAGKPVDAPSVYDKQ
jgi:hypothetical protein